MLMAKFFVLLVRNRMSPTIVDNLDTCDRLIIVAAHVSRIEIDFPRLLLVEIH